MLLVDWLHHQRRRRREPGSHHFAILEVLRQVRFRAQLAATYHAYVLNVMARHTCRSSVGEGHIANEKLPSFFNLLRREGAIGNIRPRPGELRTFLLRLILEPLEDRLATLSRQSSDRRHGNVA